MVLLIGVSYSVYNYTFLGNLNLLEKEMIELELLESTDEVISLTNALPISDTQGIEQSETFDFAVTTRTASNTEIGYSLKIEKLSVDSGYASLEDNQIKVYLTDYNNTQLLAPTKTSDLSSYVLYSKTNSHNSTTTEIQDKYKLRVWIDQDVDASNWNENTKLQYKFKIGVGEKYVPPLDESGANTPILSDYMIPVYYDETCNDNEGCWRKADSTNSKEKYKWYDYDNKMWANAVTVSVNSSGVRTDLTEAPNGTEIPMDRINTMLVWIPRYTYTVWNYNLDGTVTSEPQEIQIEFEKETSSNGEITCEDNIQGTSDGTKNGTQPTVSEICKFKSTGAECTDSTCNGKKYTHPAFTFGDKELTGFWVGKFEVSSDIECTPGSSSAVGAGCNLTTIKPLVKPNVNSWRGAMVGTYENNMMAMNDDNNIYGFETTDDTHMIKNMEWGAVAYLSHSKYGINKEVNINNSSGYYTGRSGGNVGGSTPINGTYTDQTSTTTYNTYGFYTYDGYLLEYGTNTKSETRDLSKVASTTGNIYGVYDMSGGAQDYVMGNIVSPNGTTMMSGNSASDNNYSGYTGIVYYGSSSGDYTSYTGYYGNYPDEKYYDKYSFNTSNLTRGRSKLGDGIREVLDTSSYYGWYSEGSNLAYSKNPWFYRGGGYRDVSSGAFYSFYNSGYANTHYSSRLAISQ